MPKRPGQWTIPRDVQGPNPSWCCASDRRYSLVSIQLSIETRYLFSQADLDPTHLLLLQASRPKSLTNHVPAGMGCTRTTLLSDWAIIHKHILHDPRLLLCSQEPFPPWLYISSFWYKAPALVIVEWVDEVNNVPCCICWHWWLFSSMHIIAQQYARRTLTLRLRHHEMLIHPVVPCMVRMAILHVY
jgi:hypothetical protein